MTAPTAITTGQLVSGIIKSEPTNIAHYWSIALEPGDYHVVLDSKRVDGSRSSLGIRLSELHANGGVTDRFTDNSEFDEGVSGELLEFTDGKYRLKTSVGVVTIPEDGVVCNGCLPGQECTG